MPIDARIALMGHGVQLVDPTERRLKTAHAQFYEGEAMREQAKAKMENDTNEALKKFGSDITPETIKGMMGVNPRVAQQMQGMLSKQQADAVALQKSQFDSQESEIKYQKARVDSEAAKLSHNAQIFSTVKTPEQRLMAAQKAFQLGSMTEAEARHVLDQPFDEFTKEQEQLVNMGQTIARRATAEHAQLDEQRKKINEDREALLFPDKLAKSKADAQVAANSAITGAPNENGVTKEQQLRINELRQNMSIPELLMRAAKGDPDAKAALQLHDKSVAAGRAQVNVIQPLPGGKGADQLTGSDYLATLPVSMQNELHGIMRGDIKAPTEGTRSPRAQQILSALHQADPTFNEQRAQVRKSFATGPDGANIGSLNTGMVHMDRLSEAVKAMKNGSFTPGNELYNYFKDRFGSAAVTDSGLVTDVVVGEMAKAMKGNATDVEIEKLGKKLRASNSPEQWAGVVHHGIELMADKANTYQERFQQVAPGDTSYDVLLPSARKVLNKYGVGGALAAKPGTAKDTRPPLSSFGGK